MMTLEDAKLYTRIAISASTIVALLCASVFFGYAERASWGEKSIRNYLRSAVFVLVAILGSLIGWSLR